MGGDAVPVGALAAVTAAGAMLGLNRGGESEAFRGGYAAIAGFGGFLLLAPRLPGCATGGQVGLPGWRLVYLADIKIALVP